MIAGRLGRSVVLLERGRHPRFAIGESSTPLANLILEELVGRYDLPQLRPFTKWGSWQAAHPEISCGLKRGFSFFHHQAGREFRDGANHQHQLLVAASPHDRIADTHWYRPELDAFLVREAQQLGVVLLEEVDLWGMNANEKRPVIQGRQRGKPLEIHADFVIDASGPRGFLFRALNLAELKVQHLPPTEALFSHFTGAKRWGESHPNANESAPPFPPDDAALHHVFDGGWVWVLRFNNGLSSAGVACRQNFGAGLDLRRGEPAWRQFLERFPSIQAQFAEATATAPFVHARPLSFLTADSAGKNWALLPSAAGFIDPLLSTGFPLTLLGIERLARILENHWGRASLSTELLQYSMQTTVDLVTTERLIAALYAAMGDFEMFATLTLLYFAAASFTETARRLRKSELAGQTFLLGEHALFGPRLRSCAEAALRKPTGARREMLLRVIRQAIQPVNVAGLGGIERRNWYPALADDLLANREKLNASAEEIHAMLQRCGFQA